MNVCSWALADDAKAGSCVDHDVLMTMFNVAGGSSRMFGMLRDCKLCFPGPIRLLQKVFIVPKVEKTPFALLMGMPAIVSLRAREVFDSHGNLWHKLTSPDGSRSIHLLTCPNDSPRNTLEPGILRKKAETDDLEENRWVEIVSRLREIHTGLVGEDMVWNSWAGLLLQNQETLEARIVMPPPPKVTILFERQSHMSQQLHHIKHSLRIALDVVEEQEANVKSSKRSIDYAVLDLKNQMQQQQRNLTVHRRAIQHVLNAVTPEETAAAASTFDSVENIPDDDHSVGTRDGDNELWSDAVDRED
ncbi:hypothetical protein HDU77_005959 [Chytriomyces hyalinus]|nr:hypothetical protein HDU77_005959 [Chytriomyces hyalinus]